MPIFQSDLLVAADWARRAFSLGALANEILRLASAYFAQAELDRRIKSEGIC